MARSSTRASTARPRRARPRPRRQTKEQGRSRLPVLLLTAVFAGGLGYLVGQREVPPLPPSAPPAVATATVSCEPCGEPPVKSVKPIKKPAPKKKAITRRVRPPQDAGVLPERDPTAAVGAYLKKNMHNMSSCAPSSGARVRVHLRINAAPDGTIRSKRITNLDPLPAAVIQCVEAQLETLEPPPFDGTRPETFVLSVVL